MSVKHCVVEEEDSDMACRVLNGLQLEVWCDVLALSMLVNTHFSITSTGQQWLSQGVMSVPLSNPQMQWSKMNPCLRRFNSMSFSVSTSFTNHEVWIHTPSPISNENPFSKFFSRNPRMNGHMQCSERCVHNMHWTSPTSMLMLMNVAYILCWNETHEVKPSSRLFPPA